MFLPHLIPAWFLPHSTLSPSHPQPPFPMHPLLHLISLSQSIQIFFIGMTGPVVGDSHRHGGTMHCDGDIHMIMPSDLILQQIHLDSRSLSLFFLLFIPSPFLHPPPSLSACVFLCWLSKWFLNVALSSCYAPACHYHYSDFSAILCSSMSLSLFLVSLLLPSTPCCQSN